jgi:uncharacterized protein
LLERAFVKGNNAAADQVRLAIADGYKRLLKPSWKPKCACLPKRKPTKKPSVYLPKMPGSCCLAHRWVKTCTMAIDPGFRTGCKLVCLDEQGKLLENATIYPHTGAGKAREAEKTVSAPVSKI